VPWIALCCADIFQQFTENTFDQKRCAGVPGDLNLQSTWPLTQSVGWDVCIGEASVANTESLTATTATFGGSSLIDGRV